MINKKVKLFPPIHPAPYGKSGPCFRTSRDTAPDGRKRLSPTAQGGAGLGAFSLVEVVLAIGLATFALLVIFSLMPAGLRSLQEANRQIVETEIFNTLGAELTSTKFDDVEAHVTSRFPLYFDNEGLEIPSANGATFIVRCQALPVEGAGELRRTTVSIGFQQDPQTTGSNPARRTFLLADRGL